MNELVTSFAARFQMEPQQLESTLLSTVFPAGQKPTKEQFLMFIAVAKEYGLNPLTKEIYAFPSHGGIQPIVSIDGWLTMINRQETLDGLETEDSLSESGELLSVTAKIYIKNRSKPVTVTEYMSECRRNTDTWKKWPARMLRHKAVIQCARYAFGFSGIMDEDEYQRIERDITPEPVQVVGDDELSKIRDLLAAYGKTEAELCSIVLKIDCLESLPLSRYAQTVDFLSKKIKEQKND